jgi:hypothetical protein
MVSCDRTGGCVSIGGGGGLMTARARQGLAALLVLAVELADVVGQDVWLQVRGIVAAWHGVHVPLHEVFVVALGEAADAGEVAGEPGDAERDRGRFCLPCAVRVLVVEADRGPAGVGEPVQGAGCRSGTSLSSWRRSWAGSSLLVSVDRQGRGPGAGTVAMPASTGQEQAGCERGTEDGPVRPASRWTRAGPSACQRRAAGLVRFTTDAHPGAHIAAWLVNNPGHRQQF